MEEKIIVGEQDINMCWKHCPITKNILKGRTQNEKIQNNRTTTLDNSECFSNIPALEILTDNTVIRSADYNTY